MSCVADLQIIIKPEFKQKAEEVFSNFLPSIESVENVEAGLAFIMASVGYNSYFDILDEFKDLEIECEFIVTNISDGSIEPFTTTIHKVDGVMAESTLTQSGKRVTEALMETLAQIENGATLEELKTYIEDKVRSTC